MSGIDNVRHETVLDDTTRRVAHVYTEALYNAAAQEGKQGEVREELELLVRDVLEKDAELAEVLTGNALGRERRAELLKAFEGRTSDLLLRFLLVLNNHDRLDVLRPLAAAYGELYDQRNNRIRVGVRSAVPLDDDQRHRLSEKLQAAFGRQPVLETRVDPELLGGLVVQVEDWLYDASVRNRLESIQNDIIERSSHEIQSGRDRFSSANGD
jgi:F-type H+-transporting ATPase subunit delta